MNIVMDAVKASIEELRRRFPGKSRSWLMRSLRRFLNNDIRKLNENVWVVAGRREMGDALPQYVVRYVNGKYLCDCQASMIKRRLCTHIGAVILRNIYEGITRIVYAATINVKCRDTQLLIIGENSKDVEIRRIVKDKELKYILMASREMMIKAILACNDEITEKTIQLKPTELWKILSTENNHESA
ncbi:MAG: hypothetical protein L7H08_08305 [Vulcanisaeta sp.]|jgi:hypothetical protein|nr:hypothetical protein [Vulcanisaeta sp.]